MASTAISPPWGLGLGMDVAWDDRATLSLSEGRHFLSDKLKNYLKRSGKDFEYFFVSVQAKTFDVLLDENRARDYFDVYDQLLELLPLRNRMALHHTMLNLGTLEKDYPRELVADFTNRLIERYDIKWVNEDLGLWSLQGKMLPYPLPPVLNERGLEAAVANVEFYRRRLKAPLFVEFPGFSEGSSFHVGRLDAFDFFRRLIDSTGADCVLDTGHLLSYQWLKGRGDRFLEGLDDVLPFENCREIHLSGCSIVGGKFVDFHHGVLMDEQLVLLDYLLERCPNLLGVTYEDPKFLEDGSLIPKAVPNFEKLKTRLRKGAKHGSHDGIPREALV